MRRPLLYHEPGIAAGGDVHSERDLVLGVELVLAGSAFLLADVAMQS